MTRGVFVNETRRLCAGTLVRVQQSVWNFAPSALSLSPLDVAGKGRRDLLPDEVSDCLPGSADDVTPDVHRFA